MDEPAFLEEVRSSNPSRLRAALGASASADFSDVTFDILAGLMRDTSVQVREAAIACAGACPDTRAIPYLIAIAGGDEDESLRAFAIRCLEDHSDPSILTFYTQQIRGQCLSLASRQAMAHQLGSYDSDEAIDALLLLAKQDDHYVLQQYIAESLARLNRLRLRDYWMTVASTSEDPIVQQIADNSLHQIRYCL